MEFRNKTKNEVEKISNGGFELKLSDESILFLKTVRWNVYAPPHLVSSHDIPGGEYSEFPSFTETKEYHDFLAYLRKKYRHIDESHIEFNFEKNMIFVSGKALHKLSLNNDIKTILEINDPNIAPN